MTDDMREWMGLAAGALTTLSFVPQVRRTRRAGQARDFSLPMLLMFVGGVALWLAYGVMVNSVAVIAANAVTLVLAGYILVIKLRHG